MFYYYISIIINAYKSYQGTGMYFALFFLSLVYLYKNEKNDNILCFLLYYSVLIMFIILNPLFCIIAQKGLEEDTYVRVFWLLPIGITIAYVTTEIVFQEKKKFVLTISTIIIIIVSGKCIYNKENFTLASNWYKIPEEIKDVADYIINDNIEDKKVLCSENLVPYLRQINAKIKLYYGRRSYGGYDDIDFIEYLNSGNARELARFARIPRMKYNYIILNKNNKINEDLSKYDFELFAQTPNYDLYKYIGSDIEN